MWIEKIENTKGIRYKYTERFKNPLSGKDMKISVTLNTNSKQAQKKALEMLAEKFDEKFFAAEREKQARIRSLTFKAVAGEWLEYAKPTVKISTHKNHIYAVNQIMHYIADETLLTDFSPATAEKIINDMYYNKNFSRGTVQIKLVIIKNIFRYAQKMNYIDDITKYTEIKLNSKPVSKEELYKATNKFLSRSELTKCLSQIKKINMRIALAMEFVALTGLRCGELLALKTDDYDKSAGTINIHGNLIKCLSVYDDNAIGTPKNVYSYRCIDLNDRARQILDSFILENKRRALWNGNTYKDRGFIFTTKRGTPYQLAAINNVLKRVQIGGKKISSHIFRHTHISMLSEMGIPLKAIMQRVGHNNPNTTLKIYTHVTEQMKAEISNKIKALQF